MLFFDLLSMAVFGGMTAVVMMVAFRLAGRRVLWAVVGGGVLIAVIAFGIWNRYTWVNRAVAALPRGMVVIERERVSSFLEPWTLLVPRTESLMAFDRHAVRQDPEQPAHRWVSVLWLGREGAALRERVVECEAARWAELDAASGTPMEPWTSGERASGFVRAVCGAVARERSDF
ncbi:hypothetical protein [Pararhodospirillum photometricum]|nr:hypothetical protein [Pararhodospirillum photometricum]